jgi:hypothetical protein
MGGGAMAGAAGWLDDELACASLPDRRLERRLRRLLDQLSSAPGQPVPAALATGLRWRPAAELIIWGVCSRLRATASG